MPPLCFLIFALLHSIFECRSHVVIFIARHDPEQKKWSLSRNPPPKTTQRDGVFLAGFPPGYFLKWEGEAERKNGLERSSGPYFFIAGID